MCSPLATRKESRKRNLSFNIPIVVPLAPGVRLIENDASIVSLQDIYEQHCEAIGMKKDDPILAHTERVRALHRSVPALGVSLPCNASTVELTIVQRPELWNGRLEIAEEIANKMVGDDILKNVRLLSPSRTALT